MYPDILKNNENLFFLLAGPCVIENEEMPFEIAEHVNNICTKLNIPFIFKASYKKANRSKSNSFTGIGDIKALEILAQIKNKYNVSIVTDVHSAFEVEMAANYVDVLQIPAFLCRQTDLLLEAGKSGKFVNIKKGQFLSGESMHFAVEKVVEGRKLAGHDLSLNRVMLTERGNTFGYQDLVVDFRNIPIMREHNVPVIMDATHSLQQPNQTGGVSGGKPELIETMCMAAIACNVDGLFIETHPEPKNALSDGANMLKLEYFESLMCKAVNLRKAVIGTGS